MSCESDRAWREMNDAAAEEDAWRHVQMMQDLADEHGSRWTGFPDLIEQKLYDGFKEVQ